MSPCSGPAHQFESRVKDGPGAGEVEDLASDDVDAAVVTRVQLQHHRVELLGIVDLLRAGKNRRGLAGSRGSIEQL